MTVTQIDRDALRILQVLDEAPRGDYVDRNDVASRSGLTAERVNDAVALLVDLGWAEWEQTFGTAPFDFNCVVITARGRYERQRQSPCPMTCKEPVVKRPRASRSLQPTTVLRR